MERLSQNRGSNAWSLSASRLPRPLPPPPNDRNGTRKDERLVETSPDPMDYQAERGSEYSLPSISSLLFYAGNGSDCCSGASHSRNGLTRSIYMSESNLRDYTPSASMNSARRMSWSDDISTTVSYSNSIQGICNPETMAQQSQRINGDPEVCSDSDLDRIPDYSTYTPQGESILLGASEIPTASQPWTHHHHSAPSTSLSATQTLDRYVCSQCTKTFSRPSSLRIHSHSHTGEKPFICPHSGCGKAFSVRSNMKRHERGCHSARA
ncbi:hypothetical protein TWF102_002894 [Orbilia oligospora]|uniref:C2H2-type domain-containing protein n=2 Tax=Orbilia oligospora TaxID=2813651 RepID=A0A7C8J430_ORBOL|nr:hypothetical protein TWF102_002894 [Orbilia oligospora]KAF3079716.1 hypothetical protein TWF103_004745 [Orbilia oligospora]KAF3095111.1 hypothetical protein TWF706_007977 [Orbilia oligospora]